MKTPTKKIILGVIVMGMASTIQVFANFLPTEQLTGEQACSNIQKLYLDKDTDQDNLLDNRLYLKSNFRLLSSDGSDLPFYAGQILQDNDPTNSINSKVLYYSPEAEMLKKWAPNYATFAVLDNQTFERYSWVFPYNQRVRGIDSKLNRICFEQPTNTGASNVVSFVFQYKYLYALEDKTTSPTTPYWYNKVQSGTDIHGITQADYVEGWTNKAKTRSSPISINNSCVNYELSRCGDGVKDTYTIGSGWSLSFTGEVCDNGALNGITGCNLTCTSTDIGSGGNNERCGDEVIQEAGTYYNGTPQTPENMSFETCDDGDLTGDTGDGWINNDDPNQAKCSTQCLPPVYETFPEVFVNP